MGDDTDNQVKRWAKKTDRIRFIRSKGRRVEVDCDGGEVSSEGGLLLLREVDRRCFKTDSN